MTFLEILRPSDVVDCRTFAEYAQQVVGTPIPDPGWQTRLLERRVDEFFALYPNGSWRALVQTADWCRAKKKRPAVAAFIVQNVRFAWADGAITELNPTEVVDSNVEYAISQALETETDERWQRMLLGCIGVQNRREMLAAWRAQ